MKYFNFIIFLVGSFTTSFAQDYQLFFSDRMYIYEFASGGSSHFTIFQSDSLVMNGNDSSFFNYTRGNDELVYGCPINGYMGYSRSTWAGNECIIAQNGDNILLNNNSDSIFFHPYATINDSWILYRFLNGDYFNAIVDSIVNDSVCGTIDSVKLISIHRFDSFGSPITDSLNNFQFKLSKNFGLLYTISIKNFPQYTTAYLLKGIDAVIGDQRISPVSIFNFNVGDVFHYYVWTVFSGSHWKQEYIKYTILTKSIFPNSVTYTIDDSTYSVEQITFGNIVTLYNHITTSDSHSYDIFSHDSLFDIPMIKRMYGKNYMSSWHRSINGRRAIYTVPCIERSFPWIPTSINQSLGGCTQPYCNFPGGANWFVEGLGLFSHLSTLDSSTGTWTCQTDLLYYKKGNEIYGTPAPFPSWTNINSNNLDLKSPTLLSNPVTDFAIINSIGKYHLYDVFDDKLKNVSVEFRIEDDKIYIDCQRLSSGLYFLALGISNQPIKYLKLIVIH